MSNNNLKISVVLPVYSCEKFLERAIASVVAQTYSNWELVIVNDGSVDASLEIADKAAKKDDRIKVIDKENEGVSVARNVGMENITGDILMFLDADDWFEVTAFETVIDNWDGTVQMLLFDYWDVPEHQERKYQKHFKADSIVFKTGAASSSDKGTLVYPLDKLELTILGFCCGKKTKPLIQAPWAKAFRTDYLKKIGCLFPKGIFDGEDWVFNLRAVDKMTYVRYISKPVYCYFINPESVTSTRFQKNGEKLLQNMIERNNCVKEIFLKKNTRLYEDAYCQYLYDGVKIILWWLAEERDKDKKKSGREFCYMQAREISKHLCNSYSVSDRIVLWLCQMKCFGIIEMIVGIRKKTKRLLNMR